MTVGFEIIQKWDSPRQAFVGRGCVVLDVLWNETPERSITLTEVGCSEWVKEGKGAVQ